LIDDALSALDAHVGKNIMKKVFKEYLKNKTRVIVTHLLNILPDSDRVILISDGKIAAEGTFEII
jgi:ABC-type multidrug transport system fused ATPase/permease subunit